MAKPLKKAAPPKQPKTRKPAIVRPYQAYRYQRNPAKRLEPHQLILLEKVIVPRINEILVWGAPPIYIGDSDFDFPVSVNGTEYTITPVMLEWLRRLYSRQDEKKKEEEEDDWDALAVAVSEYIDKQEITKDRDWQVVIYPRRENIAVTGVVKTCCLEFR